MQITFDDLLNYCFKELPYERQKMVEHLIIFDDNYLEYHRRHQPRQKRIGK